MNPSNQWNFGFSESIEVRIWMKTFDVFHFFMAVFGRNSRLDFTWSDIYYCSYVQFSISRYQGRSFIIPWYMSHKLCGTIFHHGIIYFEEIHLKVKFFFEMYISWGATLLTSGKSKRGWRAQLIMWPRDDPYLHYINSWPHFFRSNISSNSYISRTEKMIR